LAALGPSLSVAPTFAPAAGHNELLQRSCAKLIDKTVTFKPPGVALAMPLFRANPTSRFARQGSLKTVAEALQAVHSTDANALRRVDIPQCPEEARLASAQQARHADVTGLAERLRA